MVGVDLVLGGGHCAGSRHCHDAGSCGCRVKLVVCGGSRAGA